MTTNDASCSVPPGFHHHDIEFCSKEEAEDLIEEVSGRRWQWEGFSERRRVQRYNVEESPPMLQTLVNRLPNNLKPPHQVIVEEHTVSQEEENNASTAPEEILTLFESNTISTCRLQECDCYVGQCVLSSEPVAVSQTFHLPVERRADSWRLKQYTSFNMEPLSLYTKTSDCLWNWRSCLNITTREKQAKKNAVALVIKFVRLSLPDKDSDDRSNRGSTVNPERTMPSLSDLLTIVVTTSPIKSHPSTELLERTMETFVLAGENFYKKCQKIIVCDGCRVVNDDCAENKKKVSRKHANVKQALRNGIATSQQSENYKAFKERLRRLCQDNVEPFFNTTVVELDERHGYGFALRHVIQNHIQTKYVCVVQHDRTFMRPTPVSDVVKAMWCHSDNYKYVGMSMRSNLTYSDLFLSKYGKVAYEEFLTMMERPPQLALDKTLFGPNSQSTQQMRCGTEKMRSNLLALAESYQSSVHYIQHTEWLKTHPTPQGKHQLSLTPTLFWYDNTHICESAHYSDYIFEPLFKMVARGGFVEDKTSPVIAKSCQRLGLKEGHAKFGCYLLDDHSGMFFTGHLDGGSYLTQAGRDEIRNQFGKKQNGSKN